MYLKQIYIVKSWNNHKNKIILHTRINFYIELNILKKMTNTASRMEYNMHLTFDPRCYLGRTILMQIQEVRQHVTLRKLDLSKGEHKEEKYLKINPRGLSPTLQDDPEKHTFNDRYSYFYNIFFYCK